MPKFTISPKKKKSLLSALDELTAQSQEIGLYDSPKPPKRPVQAIEIAPTEVVAPPATEGLQVSVESRKSLPVLQNQATDADLAVIRRKRRMIPTRVCDTCYLKHDCPGFSSGSVCAYEDAFKAFPTRDVTVVLELMRTLVEDNVERLEFAKHAERISAAGQALPEVTKLSEVVLSQSKMLLDLQQDINKITVTAVGSEKKEGILSRLFGGGSPQLESPKVETEIPLVSPDVSTPT